MNDFGSMLDIYALEDLLLGNKVGTAFGTIIGIDIAYKIYEYVYEKISLND